MAMNTVVFVVALAVASLAAPAEEAIRLPEKTEITAHLNVQPALSSPPANEKQEQEQQLLERQPQEPVAPLAEIRGGEPSPDLLAEAESPDGDKSDLDTANSYWGGWGWRRRGWGWGGGWGGYYRPYWGYKGYGWGRGYGGWGGYYW